ncbi:GNAT family N-acetyltransferase [Aeromicrobium sp. CF4.19]|uniref:GNAT family N-acetyltransferase n=1 Tax=Aeromicrobium sp. CF4.19 TaxID=3373082 RepID=UPI003EE4EFFB
MDGLSTSRLLLPPLTRDHLIDMSELYADPEVARYVGGDALTAERIAEQVGRFEQEWTTRGYGQSAVILRTSSEFVGRIGLHYWPHWDEVELGYILKRSAQGIGLASEGSRAWIAWAGSTVDIDSLIANIAPRNAPSIALAERLGFTFERHDVTPTGKPTLIYRLLTS